MQATATTTTHQARILNAINRLADTSGYTHLTHLRTHLADLDHDSLSQALLDMDRSGRIQLDPNPNRYALTDADRAAAIRLGGEDMHLVSAL